MLKLQQNLYLNQFSSILPIIKSPIHFKFRLISNSKKGTIKIRLINSKKKKKNYPLNVTNKAIYGPILKKSYTTDEDEKNNLININTSKNINLNEEKATSQPETNVESSRSYTSNFESSKDLLKSDSLNNGILSSGSIEKNGINLVNSSRYKLPSLIDFESFKNFPFLNKAKDDNKFTLLSNDISSISIFEGGYKKLPSVRNILEVTMPPERKSILEKWKMNMIMKLGEEGFKNYRQGLLDRGKIIHECIELKLRNQDVSEEQLVGIEQYWASLTQTLTGINNVRLLESRVIHPSLHYQGSIDCVGMYKDSLVVMEFKTSSKPKLTLSSTYDDPLQLTAYLGALNYDSSYNLPNIKSAILVVAYSTGLPAHVHLLSSEKCQKYWSEWCQRLSQFWMIETDNQVKENL